MAVIANFNPNIVQLRVVKLSNLGGYLVSEEPVIGWHIEHGSVSPITPFGVHFDAQNGVDLHNKECDDRAEAIEQLKAELE